MITSKQACLVGVCECARLITVSITQRCHHTLSKLSCSKVARYGQHPWRCAQTAKSIIPNSSVDCTHRPIRFLLASEPVSDDLHSSETCSIPSSHFDRCRLYSLVQEPRSEASHSALLSGTRISLNSSDRKFGRPLSELYTLVKRYIVNSVRRLDEAMIQDSQVGRVRESSALQVKPAFAARKARSWRVIILMSSTREALSIGEK